MAHIELTDDSFQSEVLDSDKVVLVDFWAPWCMPCQMLAPIIDQVAEEIGEDIKVGKLNVDENQTMAGKYEVRSIPNVMIFKGGEVVEQIVGLRPKEDYVEAVKKHI